MTSFAEKKRLICNTYSNTNIEKKILKSYLDTQIKLLFKKIHTLYPDLFTEEDLKKELINYFKWKPKYTITTFKPKSLSYINSLKKQKQTLKAFKNIKHNGNINSSDKGETYKEQKKIPADDIRCIARVFDVKKIIYKSSDTASHLTNDKQLIDKDDKIDLNGDLSKYTFGRQCYKKHKKDSKYCFIHIRNNPHGNFNEPVSMHIKDHFIKMYKKFN